MARLATTGFEVQKLGATAVVDPEGQSGLIALGTPTIETTTTRSGLASLKCAATGTGQGYTVTTFTGALDRDYYARSYIQISNNTPTQNVTVLELYTAGVEDSCRVMVKSGTKDLILVNKSGTQIGSGAFTMTPGTWYRVGLHVKVVTGGGANSTAELYVDGAAIQTSTTADLGSTALTAFVCAAWAASSPGTFNVFHDDVALNDSTGAAQTSFPGEGRVVLLKPISDSARTGFTGGAGGTTNLFDAVNNYPPTGVITTGTNATQIGSATSNTTDNYQPNLGAYTTAVASGGGGMAASDTVTLVQALARGGNSTTTSRNFGIQSVSNPAITEVTQATGTTAAGTETTGWTTKRTAVTYAPSVTLGTSPVLEFRKATASTNNMMSDLMGMYVEYVPSVLLGTLSASATGSATLAVTSRPVLDLGAPAASGAGSASLALTVTTMLSLGTSSGVGSATLAIATPEAADLGSLSSNGVATVTLATSASTQLSLGATSGVGAATLTFSVTQQIALSTSGSGSATVALVARSIIATMTTSGTGSASLGLTLPGTSASTATQQMLLQPVWQPDVETIP